MIEIPFPMFVAIWFVLCIGYAFNFNRYIRIVSLVLFFGFWFSFKASGLPSIDIGTVDTAIWYAIGKTIIAIIVVALGMFYLKKLWS